MRTEKCPARLRMKMTISHITWERKSCYEKDIKIRVNEENREKLQAVLDDVLYRCKVRTIDADAILTAMNTLNMKFRDVPKSRIIGVKAEVDPHAQTYANAYKHIPESTKFTLEMCPTGWFCTEIKRAWTGGSVKQYHLTLPEETREAIINSFLAFG